MHTDPNTATTLPADSEMLNRFFDSNVALPSLVVIISVQTALAKAKKPQNLVVFTYDGPPSAQCHGTFV